MSTLLPILIHALMITSFVFIMMLLIEYINIQTKGIWQQKIQNSRLRQYLLASLLGAIPGCLGAFTVVSLYSHRILSLGALVAAMIATSGDEAFVMFAMFPAKATLLTVITIAVGIGAAFLTDKWYKNQDRLLTHEHNLPIHDQEQCTCFNPGMLINQLKNITFPRALLMIILILFLIFEISGTIGGKEWNWIKITFTGGALFSLFVVSTVPDHFLEKHIWDHVLKRHLLRIFLWTFGALLFIHYLEQYINLKELVADRYLWVLLIAVLAGIIPESGPHLVFVTLFATGTLPFGILLANSIVQDGHGMLPMLAVSRRGFIVVKLINMAFGLLAGLVSLLF